MNAHRLLPALLAVLAATGTAAGEPAWRVETALEVESRQVSYLLLVLAGLGGVVLASAVWTRLAGR